MSCFAPLSPKSEPGRRQAPNRAQRARALRTKPIVRESNERIQRKCSECVEEDQLQRQHDVAGAGVRSAFQEQLLQKARSGGGTALPPPVRHFMEPRFGASFEGVRLHDDATASTLAKGVNARAFTIGRDIFFKQGEFRPDTNDGRRLVAHELAHVLQQRAGMRLQRQALDGDQLANDATSEEKQCPDVKPFGAFPTCDEVNPRPTGALPPAPRWSNDPTLAEIRLEPPGRNKTLLSRARGSRGEPVGLVQQALLAWGCRTKDRNLLPVFGADGIVGSETEAAIKKFQCELGLVTDGIVGPITLGSLDTFVGAAPPFVFPPGLEPPGPLTETTPTDVPPPTNEREPVGPIKSPIAPAGFCEPYSSKIVALLQQQRVLQSMLLFTAKFGSPDVTALWITYLTTPKSGTRGVLPPRRIFDDATTTLVKSFVEDPETDFTAQDVLDRLAAELVANHPELLPPFAGGATLSPPVLISEILGPLDDLPMSFEDPFNRIPALIAGGPGKGASDAGDDTRSTDGAFVVEDLGGGNFRIRATLEFDVMDAVDFCPGAPGSEIAQLLVTKDMSRLEATPDVPTYDTPFEVKYSVVKQADFKKP
jgi:peptidoglycan hydrolase-like protein with peptidoglycan-binding domain